MEILEVLKYTLPALIVFLTAYFIIRKFIDNEIKKRAFDLSSMNNDLITPVRLQAYERLALFLERISPEFLIMRTNLPGMTAKQLHTELLVVIRTEFEHNLSQQIYVSQKTWEIIKNCRGNLLKIINSSAAVVSPDSPSINLSKAILEKIMDMEQSPTDEALAYLKKEIQTNFF
jgi:hypothetical protein